MMNMEANADECHQSLKFGTPESSTEAGEYQKFSTINFMFSCMPVYFSTILDQDGALLEILDHDELPIITKALRVDLQDSDRWEEANQKLDEVLGDFPMSNFFRQELINFAAETATDILVQTGHHVLNLHIPFEAIHEHIFEHNDAKQIRSSSARVSPLKNKVTSSCEDYGRCAICLKDFYEGCEVLCLPCSHIFHGNCINTSLRYNNRCPLCRFELPTN